jgi:hypothetical protein
LAYADAATPCDTLSTDQCQQQIQRIIRSSTFRNALTLQQLFQFVAEKAVSGTADGLKEYTIGVEAFGRKQDFDPKTDPIVRVQIHRLRQKLREYYELEGSQDPVLVEVPKGHYLPHFESVSSPASGTADSSAPPATRLEDKIDSDGTGAAAERRRVPALIGLLAAGAILFVAGFSVGNLRTHTNSALASSNGVWASGKLPDPVKAYWGTFLGSDSAPIIAYPDAVFLLDDSNDLFRFRQGASDGRGALVDSHLAERFASNPALVAKAGQLYYENGYTGTGELEAVGMLTELFGQMGVKPIIKSSRDITPDDLKQHNVILLGSPFQNIAVAQLLPEGDFAFDNPDSRREEWRAQITNAHPRANESETYHTERDPLTRVLKVDYSLISIQPGIVPGRYIAIIGGLDTKGTEGAAMFATSQTGLDVLSRNLAASGIASPKGQPPVFQALVRVRLEKGYQVLSSDLVAVHKLAPLNANSPQTSDR